MPITHAHPAAVLPLIIYGRRVFSASALVIGSMAPDFPYFFFNGLERKETHNLSGIFLYCLPMGLCVYVLYQRLLRPALLDYFCQRDALTTPALGDPYCVSWRYLPVIVFSLIIGAATHNFWDSLTHGTGWFPQRYAFFNEHVWFGRPKPLFRVLQYLSGILGTIVVFWFFLRTLIRHQLIHWEDRAWRRQFLKRLIGLGALAGVFGLGTSAIYLHYRGYTPDVARLHSLLRYWIISSTDFILCLGVLRGIQLHRKHRTRSAVTPFS